MRSVFVMLLCLLGLALTACDREAAKPSALAESPASQVANIATNGAEEDDEDKETIFLESLGFGGHGVIPAAVHIQCTNAQCGAIQIKRWNDCDRKEVARLLAVFFAPPDGRRSVIRPKPLKCETCRSDMGPMRKCGDCEKWYLFDVRKNPHYLLDPNPKEEGEDMICPHCHFNESEAYRKRVAALRENLNDASVAIAIYKEKMAEANRQLDEAVALIQDNKLDEADAILKQLESNMSNMGNDVQKRIKALRQAHTDKKATTTE